MLFRSASASERRFPSGRYCRREAFRRVSPVLGGRHRIRMSGEGVDGGVNLRFTSQQPKDTARTQTSEGADERSLACFPALSIAGRARFQSFFRFFVFSFFRFFVFSPISLFTSVATSRRLPQKITPRKRPRTSSLNNRREENAASGTFFLASFQAHSRRHILRSCFRRAVRRGFRFRS